MSARDQASRLRRAMEERGLAAADLARQLKVSQPTVHGWLHGLHGLRTPNARRAARALGVSPAWLMFGTDRGAEQTAQTGDELALLRLYRELEPEQQAAVLRRMRAAAAAA